MPKCYFCDKEAVATIRYMEKDNDIFYAKDVCDKCYRSIEEENKIIHCTFFDKEEQAKYESSKATTKNYTSSSSSSSTETTSGLDKLFSNPGESIKTLAKIVFVIGLVIAVIGAIVCWAIEASVDMDGTMSVVGFAVLFVLPLISWVSCLFLYGFGELIENTEEIKNNTKK